MTERLDRAIEAANNEVTRQELNAEDWSWIERDRVYARALIADLLLPDGTEPSKNSNNYDGYMWAISDMRKRAGLIEATT